ncbi:hypothetical protein SAMN05444392_106112 [Seinonella peptonophila]|uniref:Uncharacterized protein n=1 Tax=Seinonella peptonophila TaxID=112248 RepID=A0A1M4Y974_9BACL|nr:hypothetical protein SAMN05444392_106112 [Seinonella peptonophila]
MARRKQNKKRTATAIAILPLLILSLDLINQIVSLIK